MFSLHTPDRKHVHKDTIEINGRIDANGAEIEVLDEEDIKKIKQIQQETGISSVAICLINSIKNPRHEETVARWATESGFSHIYMSHRTSPNIGWWYRTSTTLLDAYLTAPVLNYTNSLRKYIDNTPLRVMQSFGGLCDTKELRGSTSLLSGPAGGIYGAIYAAKIAGFDKIITFDMGGTSTDVARYNGTIDRKYNQIIDGMPLNAPTLAIETIAAGGGSKLHYTNERMIVGPDSAGSHPGPACYRKGGSATITDANVVLGRIQPLFFPRLFGINNNESIDTNAAEIAILDLCQQINKDNTKQDTIEETAEKFISVAVQSMASAIHKISVARGFDVREYALCAFGGAGGQHACLVAEALGIKNVIIHKYSSVLSAFGMGIAPETVIEQKYLSIPCNKSNEQKLFSDYNALSILTRNKISLYNNCADDVKIIATLQLHYHGSDNCIDIHYKPIDSLDDLCEQFHRQHRTLFGINDYENHVIIKNIIVEAQYHSAPPPIISVSPLKQNLLPIDHQAVYSKGKWNRTPIYELSSLNPQQIINGPALLIDNDSTIMVETGWQAIIGNNGILNLKHTSNTQKIDVIRTDQPDPAYLEIFHNLFSSIAENMGETFAKTAHSVNIKERRDFSCAIFDNAGNLIANAPHVPVHLGSMGQTVKALINSDLTINQMDSFITNDPYNGGTHLPDITVITPVFINDTVSYFVASRGHHADIGGITPGSMPANSTNISQEGILIPIQHLVKDKTFQTQTMRSLLSSSQYPARNIEQNISDLQAAVSANRVGVIALRKITERYGADVITAYMDFILENAERHVLNALKNHRSGRAALQHDNGSIITVNITINPLTGRSIIDFSGSSAAGQHNLNAPIAITKASVLYVMRSLINQDIPLNDGCLRAIDIIVPDNSILNPSYPHAVSGGNVETSQIIVDTILQALNRQAGSQGTMNNISFGNATYQYYETLAGGAGAGEGFNGSSGYQCQMTNSRLTDIEVLEERYPVLINRLSMRKNSGGNGKYRGGDGIIREIEFLDNFDVSIISNNRINASMGLNGGKNGHSGVNTIIPNGTTEPAVIDGCCQIHVNKGDRIIIFTPGGGGYGDDGVVKTGD